MTATSDLYAALAAKFDQHRKLPKGGVKLDYLDGEQVISRLNETLGVDAWGFEVLEHGQLDKDYWVRARMTVYFPERTVVREQFGGVTGNGGMSPADSLKGAATDALKKCATLIGVGLYLSDKDESLPVARPAVSAPAPLARAPGLVDGAQASPVRAPESAQGGGAPSRRFEGGTNERAQQFIKACQTDLNLDVAAVSKLLGGKVSDYLRTQRCDFEEVYQRLARRVHHDEPIPVMAERVEEAVG